MDGYCQCGCGQLVSKPGNKYIHGHHNRGARHNMKNPETAKKSGETRKKSKLSKGTIKDSITLCLCGCSQFVSKPGNKFIVGHWVRVNQPSKNPEVVKKISETKKSKNKGENNGMYGQSGPKNPAWTGGDYRYWHTKARELFGLSCCELCGFTNKEHLELYKTRLHMHCTSIPKDYTIMESNNWQTLCVSCHGEIETEEK